MRIFIAAIALSAFASLTSAQAACVKIEHNPVDLSDYYADTLGRTGDDLKAALNEIIRGHEDNLSRV